MKKLIAVFLFTLLLPIIVRAQSLDTAAKQAIIMDYDTGQILFEKNAHERMPTSSMSKVMTMYMVFDAIKKGKLSLDDTFLVSEKAWRKQGSKMFIKVGDNVRVEDLIRGVVVQSGNDATIALAEGLAGSEEAFALAMNKKAKELGMNDSHFMNASGWPDSEHYSTAYDLAVLGMSVIRDFPDLYKYYSEESYVYNNITQQNRNPLLYLGLGADGIKTGHTEDGGYGLIGSAVKDGRRVVMVINGIESSSLRKQEAGRLMQWALNGFQNLKMFANNEELEKVPVLLGNKLDVAVKAAKPIVVTIPKLHEDQVKVEISYNAPVVAPVGVGQELGKVLVHVPGSPVIEVPLVAAKPVAEMNYFLKLISKARLLTSGQGAVN